MDKLLSKNSKYNQLISGKHLELFDTKTIATTVREGAETRDVNTIDKDDRFYQGSITTRKRIFRATDWTKQGDKEKEKAEQKIKAAKAKLHEVKVKIKSYAAHRKALLMAFRYNLPNLGNLIEDYITEFYK